MKPTCLRCGAGFKRRSPSIVAVQKFCSRKCWDLTKRKDRSLFQGVCVQCGGVFEKKKPSVRKKYCKRACLVKSQTGKRRVEITGERHPNWQGGKTSTNEKLRKSIEYNAWRKKVFERDGYKCVECGDDRGGNLEADHIKPWALYPGMRFDVGNGRTLCHECHSKTPTYLKGAWRGKDGRFYSPLAA